jgi:uncharacterized delta-60 repeat protein
MKRVLLFASLLWTSFYGIGSTDLNTNFGTNGIAYSSNISNLFPGGSTVVDSLQRVLVSGVSGSTLIVARFLPNGILDSNFGVNGIAQTLTITGLISEFVFLAVDSFDNVYVTGLIDVSGDTRFIVAKFLGTDGSLDSQEFNPDGTIPGIAESNSIPDSFFFGGYIAIDYLGNIIVCGSLPVTSLIVARFGSNGSIDTHFGGQSTGIATVSVDNLVSVGPIATNPSILLGDNSIYIGGETLFNQDQQAQFVIIKLTPHGDIDTSYGTDGYAYSSEIDKLGSYGSIAINYDNKIVIAGISGQEDSPQNQFVVARFDTHGFPDTTFNDTGISYSNSLGSIDYFEYPTICIDSNNNVVVSAIANTNNDNSIVVARMIELGAIDTTLSATGMVTTGTILGLESGGFIAVNALNNIFVGGQTSNKILVAEFYSGAEIFIESPQDLYPGAFKIYYYGNNLKLFKDYLAVEFYAQVIADTGVRTDVIDRVNALLDDYAVNAGDQIGLNLAACTTPILDGDFSRLQALLIIEHAGSTDDIIEFFRVLTRRKLNVRAALESSSN